MSKTSLFSSPSDHFRRLNYGDRTEFPIDDLLVAIDLLTPVNPMRYFSTRILVDIEKVPHIIINEKNKQGKFPAPFRITSELHETLLRFKLAPRGILNNIFHGGEIYRKRKRLLDKLLYEHDRMHIDDRTPSIKRGIYQYFGNSPTHLFRVFKVENNHADGAPEVIFCPLRDTEFCNVQAQTLSMFTQAIARTGYIGPRWTFVRKERVR